MIPRMPQREEMHKLIELLPESEVRPALRYLQYLCGMAPAKAGVLVVDDPGHEPEAPESPEEQAAWRDYERHLAKLPPLEAELADEDEG